MLFSPSFSSIFNHIVYHCVFIPRVLLEEVLLSDCDVDQRSCWHVLELYPVMAASSQNFRLGVELDKGDLP